MDQVSEFLEHYGVKGMKKPVSPAKLDRVYRIANGTAILKDRVQKARRTEAKAAADKLLNAQVEFAQASAKVVAKNQAETEKPVGENPQEVVDKQAATAEDTSDPKEDVAQGETEIKKILQTCGATKLTDLG